MKNVSIEPIVKNFLKKFQSKPYYNFSISIDDSSLVITNSITDMPIRRVVSRMVHDYNFSVRRPSSNEPPYYFFDRQTEWIKSIGQRDVIKLIDSCDFGSRCAKRYVNLDLLEVYTRIRLLQQNEEVHLIEFKFTLSPTRSKFAISINRNGKALTIRDYAIDFRYSEEEKKLLQSLVENTIIE